MENARIGISERNEVYICDDKRAYVYVVYGVYTRKRVSVTV